MAKGNVTKSNKAPIVKTTRKYTAVNRLSYNTGIRDLICGLIAQGYSFKKIAAVQGMPTEAGMWQWLQKHEDFVSCYTRAKQQAVEKMANDIMDIADDDTNDFGFKETEDGTSAKACIMPDNIQRSKLRVDTRKWLMSKLMPKKYGDKLDVEQSGEIKISVQREIIGKRDS